MSGHNVVLEGMVGSRAYGLATPYSDQDFLGIYVEPLDAVLGLNGASKTDQSYVQRSPDRTIHELGKFCRLALAANPTISELLWLPEYVLRTQIGDVLIDARSLFLSQRVRNTYGGYAFQQLNRLKQRGDFSSDLRKRTEKHGRHCYRLAIQGAHILREGQLKVRLEPEEADACFEAGELAVSNVGHYEQMIMELLDRLGNIDSLLPEVPNVGAVNDLLVDIRLGNNI